MSKRTEKRKYTVEDAADVVTSRLSDIREAESEEESVMRLKTTRALKEWIPFSIRKYNDYSLDIILDKNISGMCQ